MEKTSTRPREFSRLSVRLARVLTSLCRHEPQTEAVVRPSEPVVAVAAAITAVDEVPVAVDDAGACVGELLALINS